MTMKTLQVNLRGRGPIFVICDKYEQGETVEGQLSGIVAGCLAG